jgi:cytochrome c
MKRWSMSRRLVGRVCLRGAIAAWVPMLMLGAWVSAQEATAKRSVGDGVYTDAQAERGKAAYEKDCAFCHLSDLTGQGFAPGLIEDNFKHRWQDGTVAELFAVVKATMPQDKPESLPDPTYADIVAYLLQANKYPAGQGELKPDPAALKEMPFKGGAK